MPEIVSVNQTAVTINIKKTVSNGGSDLLSYKLFRNQGSGTIDFVLVSTHDPYSLTTTVTGLTVGQVYMFRTQAIN
jgi:hypothetical protein